MRRGALLVLVLWVLVIAGVMLVGLNRTVQVDSAIAYGQLEAVRAHWAARAGIEQAKSVLDFDSTLSDDTTDYWYDSDLDFETIELPGGSTFSLLATPGPGDPARVRYGMTDEASAINVNHADAELLAALPEVTAAQVDAIIDWRDRDENAQPAGAERGQYNRLDHPYEIRNGPMHTHREMLLIEGIDTAAFYGEDLDGDGVLSPGENDGDAAPPDDNRDGMLDHGLRRWTTVYSYVNNRADPISTRVNLTDASDSELQTQFSFTRALAEKVREKGQSNPKSLLDFEGLRGESSSGSRSNRNRDRGSGNRGGGSSSTEEINEVTLQWLAAHWEQLTLSDDERLPGLINVNTAPREVLQAVPGLTDEAVEALLDGRSSGTGGLSSVGDLLTTGTLTADQWKQVAPHLTVRSNMFRIISEGRSGRAVRRIEAVLDRGNGLAVVYWRQDGQ